MRRSRLFVVLFVVAFVAAPALLAATSNPNAGLEGSALSKTPAKICHPKKPLTCRAAELATLANAGQAVQSESLARWVTTPKADPSTEEMPKVGVELGRVCFPPRWLCKAPVL